MLVRILIGVAVIIVGFFMVWKPRFFYDFMGHQMWAEKIFGIHEDELAYKVIGVIVMFVGALIATDLIYNLLAWFFSPVVKGLK
ncbi:MAG: hypothetical protein WCT16_03205 [Candidatus Buchananbacteria bacterium]